jgi:LysM repeat protein
MYKRRLPAPSTGRGRTRSNPERRHRIVRPSDLRLALAVATLVILPASAGAQSLRGSRASLDIQNRMAKTHQFTFLRTETQLEKFVRLGYLVPVQANSDFELHQVSFPYTRAETALFVKRLAAQYRASCRERLVVTSLTRPSALQPRNASDRSVHPTGMALDLRIPRTPACRRWLEQVLLELEDERVIEATRERRPAHYHIAVFPEPYRSWVDGRGGTLRVVQAALTKPTGGAAKAVTRYEVRRGDSLWNIARKHGTTVAQLRAKNALGSNRILPGQVLEVPASH